MGLSSKQVPRDHVKERSNGQSFDAAAAFDLPRQTHIRRRNQQQSDPLRCPRCDSTNTKFCYYNNYNRSQPRHFCKACKRHWTNGGTLRNVPVGGGRKNRRLNASDTAAAATKAANPDGRNRSKTNIDSEGGFLLPLAGGENMSSTPNFCSSISFNGLYPNGESGISMRLAPPSLIEYHDLQVPSSGFGSSLGSSQSLVSSTAVAMKANGSEAMGIACVDTSLSSSSLSDHQPWGLMTSPTCSNNVMDMTFCNLDWEDIDKFAHTNVMIPWDDAEIMALF